MVLSKVLNEEKFVKLCECNYICEFCECSIMGDKENWPFSLYGIADLKRATKTAIDWTLELSKEELNVPL